MPENEIISFHDMVRGEQRFESSDLGDFVIRRADGTAPFMYGNAIDDALMEVTHVLRGEDHLTNTPRQIAILNALNFSVPTYGHIALIVGQDGSPLSKRHGSRSIRTLHQEGFLPMAIVNYLARLGHYYGHDHYLTLDELAAQFNVDALAKSPAKFNEQQLLYWQTQTILQLSDTQFWDWVGEATQNLVPDDKRQAFVEAIKPNVQFPDEVKAWAECLFVETIHWTNEQQTLLHTAGKHYFSAVIAALELYNANADAVTAHLKEKCGVKGRALFMPLRIVLTGHEHGPDFAKIFALLDLEMIKKRLKPLS
jgi:glutamyl-tRNA synthetase